MQTMTLDQVKDKYYGKTGTPIRDRSECELSAQRISLQARIALKKFTKR